MTANFNGFLDRKPIGPWGAYAACHDRHHLFYGPDRHEPKLERLRREVLAKQLCAVCPVIDDCRHYALEQREKFGIWGGLTPQERGAVRVRSHHKAVA